MQQHLVVDIETTYQKIMKDGKFVKSDPSPYHPDNRIVLIQYKLINTGEAGYVVMHHNEMQTTPDTVRFKELFGSADIIAGHNLKFDLSWLLECGFVTKAKFWDTMIFEYLQGKGTKHPINLEASAIRRGLEAGKLDVWRKYFDLGLNTDEMPLAELIEYGMQDVEVTEQLYRYQRQMVKNNENDAATMFEVFKLTCDALRCIIDMERSGVKIDKEALAEVKKTYEEEYARLSTYINHEIRDVMGDTPININSPEDMSKVVYSIGFKPNAKSAWAEQLDIGSDKRGSVTKSKKVRLLPESVFRKLVSNHFDKIEKTEAHQCDVCNGKGKILKTKKNGEPFSKENICKNCNGTGFLYTSIGKTAGFMVRPISSEYATANGFALDKTTVHDLLEQGKLKPRARDFLTALAQINAIDTYLNSFVLGIEKATREDGILHPTFNQCVTATGRLSGTDPNLQNQPRGRTFPVRKVFISRFDGGELLDVDFSALEYRAAVILADCPVGKKSIIEQLDRHTITMEIIFGKKKDELTKEEFSELRQKSKAHCFPLHTEILTTEGWKKYNEIKIGDTVINYNPVTKTLVNDVVIDYTPPHKQEVVEMHTQHNWAVQSTPEHRWYCEKRVRSTGGGTQYKPEVVFTKNINSEHRIITSASYYSSNTINISVDEAALIGWIFTDGFLRVSPITGRTSQGSDGARRSIVSGIVQKKYVSHIDELCNSIGLTVNKKERGNTGVYAWNFSNPEIRDILNRANVFSNKDLLDFVIGLPKEHREAFLNSVKLAEGTQRTHGEWRIAQNSGPTAEAIKLAAFLSGYDIRVTKVIMKYNGNQHEQITLRTRPYVTGQRIVKESKGEQLVWCVTTNNKTVVIRQGETISISGQTFKPLYGGQTGTEDEMRYYKAFLVEHTGIAAWHKTLEEEVILNKQIVTPTGRVFAFPHAARRSNGSVTNKTQLVNYPVQSFATADLAWCVIYDIYVKMKELNLQSKLILQVHDSVTIDTHPTEREKVIEIVQNSFDKAIDLLYSRFKFKTDVPIGYEMSIGKNWMDKEVIYKTNGTGV